MSGCEHPDRVDATTYNDLPTRRQVCTSCGATILVAIDGTETVEDVTR